MSLHDFMQHFVRHADGSWTCTTPCTLDHPNGRIQVTPGAHFTPGTIFMGIELARWLEDQWAAEHRQYG